MLNKFIELLLACLATCINVYAQKQRLFEKYTFKSKDFCKTICSKVKTFYWETFI